jgi:hypothetical protein
MKKQAIGYFNHNAYPIQFVYNGGPMLIDAGSPVVDSTNKLVPVGNEDLDRAVNNGLLSTISEDNTKFGKWNELASKPLHKPLPADVDGHPVNRKMVADATKAPIEAKAVEVSYMKGVNPASVDEVDKDRILAAAKKSIQESGSFALDGKDFRSVKAVEKYLGQKQ